MKHIYIRGDDILVPSKSYPCPFSRFKQQHEAMKKTKGAIIHRPGIIIKEIEKFPACIDYIKEETKLGNMQPQIHCRDHQSFNYKTENSIEFYKDLLWECIEWIENQLDYTPNTWYTPWGSHFKNQQIAADHLQIRLVDTVGAIELSGMDGVLNSLKTGSKNLDFYYDKEIMIHFWQQGQRVQRFCEIVKEGSWDLAQKKTPKLFR